ncbi:MAG: BlaI/MecI/CopY family transcriptional regulator [Bacteroidota bacterium]
MKRKSLTKAEEELMGHVWHLKRVTVGQLRDAIASANEGKKPAHSTVSTLMKHLVEKDYVSYEVYGRTWVYSPKVNQNNYRKSKLGAFVNRFFGGSAQSMISFLVAENDLSLSDLAELTNRLKEEE